MVTPAPERQRRRPIDTFFASLAEDQGEQAVAIVLSGVGSDGSLGVRAIKEHGGLTLAQAEFDHEALRGMPTSAAATGFVDAVVPIEAMPGKLIDYQRHLNEVAGHKDGDGARRDAAENLAQIVALLRARTGHDFSGYKDKTLTRRVQRRMQVLQIETVYILHRASQGRAERIGSAVPRVPDRRHRVLPQSRGLRRLGGGHLKAYRRQGSR